MTTPRQRELDKKIRRTASLRAALERLVDRQPDSFALQLNLDSVVKRHDELLADAQDETARNIADAAFAAWYYRHHRHHRHHPPA